MKTADLPLSANVEDRRGETKTTPRRTLAEQLAEAEDAKPQPRSPLAVAAGIEDLQ